MGSVKAFKEFLGTSKVDRFPIPLLRLRPSFFPRPLLRNTSIPNRHSPTFRGKRRKPPSRLIYIFFHLKYPLKKLHTPTVPCCVREALSLEAISSGCPSRSLFYSLKRKRIPNLQKKQIFSPRSTKMEPQM